MMLPLRSVFSVQRAPCRVSRHRRSAGWPAVRAAGLVLASSVVLAGCDDDPLLFAEPERVEAISATEQVGTVSRPTTEVPRVRVTDRRGNPVPGATVRFEVVDGSGAVHTVDAISDARGIASPGSWTLGPRTGPNRLEATVSSLTPVAFTAEATVGIDVTAVHVNQGSQTYPGHIPLVAGRAGLLRVFVQANAPNEETPDVRIDLYDGAVQVASQVVPAPSGRVPSSIEPDAAASSWNLHLPAELVGPSLGLRVTVDEDGTMEVADRSTLVWPTDGSIHRPDVRTLPPFRATFVRIFSEDLGTTADLTEENLADYMAMTLDLFPIAESDAIIRPGTYVTDVEPLSGSQQGQGWTQLLGELGQVRLMDGAQDPGALSRYYHGILRRTSAGGIAGIAYVVPNPSRSDSVLVALSHDDPTTRSRVVAHEFGHNFGRWHAPCGNISAQSRDNAFPHSGARLGSPGYSARSGILISAVGGHRDIMSYCIPSWSSDYTYEAVFDMRRARPIGSPSTARGQVDGILVSGEWSRSMGAELRPVLPLRSVPVPGSGGSAELRGYDASGALLFRRGVAGVVLDHADDPTLRHFFAFVPLPSESRDELVRVTLSSPEGDAELSRSIPPPGAPGAIPPTGLQVDGVAPPPGGAAAAPGATSWSRVRWNAEDFPLVVLRDEGSGRVLSLARRGDVRIPRPESGRLHVQLSDGVGTLDEVVPVP